MNRSITLVFVFVFLTASFISMADAQTSIATNAFIGLQPAIATISQQAKSPTVILSVPNPSPAPEPTAAPPADTGDFWTQKASMHVARSNLGVTVANGKIYAIGGNTENGYVPNSAGNNYKTLGWISGANEEYDPIIDTWTLRKPMPTPRVDFAIATYENKVYCMGGIANWVSGQISYTGVNEVYDPATDTWETRAPMPNATSARANVVSGKIYLIGGGSNETLNQVYDPETDSWITRKPMLVEPDFQGANTISPIAGLVSAVFDNRIHVMSYSFSRSANLVYEPTNDSWRIVTSSPFNILDKEKLWWSQASAATTGVLSEKRIYIFFARYPSDTLMPNLDYDPSTTIWTVDAAVPTYRVNFGTAVLNDTLYTIGGRIYNYPYPADSYFTVTESAVNQQYTPAGYGTPDPTYQTPTPIPTPSPSQSPSPSPSPSPTPSQTPTQITSPTPSASPQLTRSPEPELTQNFAVGYVAVAAVAATIIAVAVVYAFRKRDLHV